MSKQPDVSICIPSYNGVLTIERAIKSARKTPPRTQGGEQITIEMVVCDDGSSDGTGTMAALLGAKVIRQKENGGAVAALNAAMDAATGRYLMFHGDDDWVMADGVAALVQALDEHPEHGFAYGGVKYWGKRSDYVLPPEFRKEDFYRHFACLDGFIFRREAWDGGLRWRSFKFARGGGLSDWDFVLQLIETLGWTGLRVDVPVLNYTLTDGRGWAEQKANEVEVLAQFKAQWPNVVAETT